MSLGESARKYFVVKTVLGLDRALIVETRFLEFAVSLLDFSPLIPLGTLSILLIYFLCGICFLRSILSWGCVMIITELCMSSLEKDYVLSGQKNL